MEQQPKTIEAQATEWVVRLDAGPLAAEDQAALDAWIAADRRHHGALIRARAAWLDTDRVASFAGGTLSGERDAGSGAPFHGDTRSSSSLKQKVTGRFLAVAATLAVLSITLGALWYYGNFAGSTYVSEVGEVRNIQLSDGSELTLNTNTEAAVRFNEAERHVLLKQGEALFEVAHDTRRPFVVYANNVRVKAVGTAFTIRVDDVRVDVTVTEGTVEVSRPGAAVQRMAANHRALIASSESRTEIQPVDNRGIDRQLAWRQGKVSFAGEPLGTAVSEINRYSRKPIYIDGATLAAQPVVGIFNASDSQGFARAAGATFDAEVVEEEGAIHLRERSMTQ